ncbi:MAG: 3-dehydroquinate dehydratase [Rubrobacter sp.]|jgi:3-dehydroquinate dehydratase-2|nr:3-dehydroquinate dehydratase [Rubrobacter sp.]
MTKIYVLNGVNLGALGTRRPEVYGSRTLKDIEAALAGEFPDVEFAFRQTDYEGEMVEWVREAGRSADAVIINPGAWTHYSYAIHDALEATETMKVEIHLSNIHAREEFRRHSVVSAAVDATVVGMGEFGYKAAVSYVLDRM